MHLTRFGQDIARASKSVAVMLFSDLASVGGMTVLMISQNRPYQSQDKSRPLYDTRRKSVAFYDHRQQQHPTPLPSTALSGSRQPSAALSDLSSETQ